MGIKDAFRKFIDPLRDTFGFVDSNVPDSDEAGKLAVFPQWFFSARLGQPRSINTNEIRDFAKSPWIQMVLNTIKKEILTIDWAILKKDDKDSTDVQQQIDELTSFFSDINSEHETISDIGSQSITDLGEIDAGIWQKVFTKESYEEQDVQVLDNYGKEVGTKRGFLLKDFGSREILEIRPADSSTFLIDIDRFRRIRWYWQYSFKNPRQNPIAFEKDEIVYMKMNQKTYSVYGFSPVQAIQQVLEVLIQSTRWNKDFFINNAIPDGVIGLENANAESMKRFKEMWNKEVKGKAHKLLFHNTKASFSSFSPTSKDMEWLQGQQWYFHLVFAVFGVSPAEAGFYQDVNRSAQEGQERVTVKNAIKPFLTILENAINRHIIPEFFQDDKPKVKFEFRPVDHAQEQIEHQQSMEELDRSALTINEHRQNKGLDPVEWGDEPVQNQSDPNNRFDNTQSENEDDKQSQKFRINYLSNSHPINSVDLTIPKEGQNNNPEPAPILTTGIRKDAEIDPGEDVIDESVDYGDFYKTVVDKWEKRVVAALNKIPLEKIYSPDVSKTFGEFLRAMMNSINSVIFLTAVKRYVKDGLNAGLESAEEELGIDIGFTQEFEDTAKVLQQQQIEGYVINGKRWHGIKGATKELQFKILKQVQEDMAKKVPRTEMVDNIKNIFEGSTTAQAERIARTETTNWISRGKLLAYKDSDIPGKKRWSAALDNRTSPICERLHRKYFNNPIPLDDLFIDDDTNKAFLHPSAHPNCRSTLSFVIDK